MDLPLFAITAVVLWASNFTAVKILIQEVPTFLLLSVRFALVFILLVPFFDKRKLFNKHLVLFGVIMGIGHFAAFFYAMNFTGAAVTAIVLLLQIPIASILAKFFLNEPLIPRQWLGFAVGLVGVALIVKDKEWNAQLVGVTACMLGGVAWSIATVYSRRHLQSLSPIEQLAGMALWGGLALEVVSLLLHENPLIIFSMTKAAWLSLGYTVVCSTFIAYGLWLKINRKYPISRTTPYMLLSPVFAMIVAHLVLGEEITTQKTISAIIVMIGVFISLKRSDAYCVNPEPCPGE